MRDFPLRSDSCRTQPERALTEGLDEDEFAAEGADAFLEFGGEAVVADDDVDLGEGGDEAHAAAGELAGVGDDDDLAGGAEHGSVGHGFFEVGAADAELGIAAGTAEEELVGGELFEHIFSGAADDGGGVVADSAAHHDGLGVAGSEEFDGDVDAVGDDLEMGDVFDLAGDLEGGGAGVQDDSFAFFDEGGGHGADALFFFGLILEALVEWGLAEDGVLDDGAAVGALDDAALMEFVEIAADGDGGGFEAVDEVVDLGAAFGADDLQDLDAAFFGHHAVGQVIVFGEVAV
jgi:hypothetical protein